MNVNFLKKRVVIVLAIFLTSVAFLSILLLIFLNKNKTIEAQITDNYIRVCVDPPTPDLSDVTQPIFKWDTFGNPQTNFQLQIDNNSDFSSPEINVSAGAGGVGGTQTRYHRSDTHTINGLNAYQLGTTNSASGVTDFTYGSIMGGGCPGVKWKADVYKRDANGNETLLGSNVAVLYGQYNGYQSATWAAPQTSLSPTDAIKVVEKLTSATDVVVATRTWITPQLNTTQLNASTWTFVRYTYYNCMPIYPPFFQFSWGLYYGSASYNTRIEGISLASGLTGAAHSYQAPTNLLPLARTYWWRVNVSDNGVRWTGWTGCNSFYLRGLNPSAKDLKVSLPDNCQVLPPVIFSWTFIDPDPTDFQTAYQVQVDNNSDFSSPEVDSCLPAPGTCQPPNGSNSYATYLGKLSYNQIYYWRLKVWDREGYGSDWLFGPSFTTPLHGYPQPNFFFSPQNPSAKEVVIFFDGSKCYSFPGNQEYDCRDNVNNRYQWDFQSDGLIDCDSNINSACRGNASTTYPAAGQYAAKLIITDDIGTCPITKSINISMPLPQWKEIAPF